MSISSQLADDSVRHGIVKTHRVGARNIRRYDIPRLAISPSFTKVGEKEHKRHNVLTESEGFQRYIAVILSLYII